MLQDLFQGGSLSRAVLEAAQDQVLALWREAPRRPEVDDGAHDLFVLFERDVAADHVVQQDSERPDRGGTAVVSPVTDPLGWRIHSRSCKTKNTH